ncbi:hypothetical protein MTF65_13300 [Streptomyces sp. APSN-46.1]|uniref:hypothetical protein n=1 Tax=Streptomyces sp. APSN-46.1 TaxID=2929049 RepID=UPI001FB289EC|nr:hypothetical protein [Streptomyces sp. APSN-46.1]MCJ1678305.1 hypothetical protein [Streptomyces sp. APSN-46.1]
MAAYQYLDWGDASHYDRTRDLPCVLCGRPTPLRSHAGEPVHKVCAEEWNHTHPAESRRHTLPDKDKQQRDIGTWRFHNDGPSTPNKATNVVSLPVPDIQTLELPAA